MTVLSLGLTTSLCMAGGGIVISQNPACDADAGSMVACGDAAGGTTAENWFARNFLIDQDVTINSIVWGGANATTITANIYFSAASGPGNPDSVTLTPVGSASQAMAAGGFYDTLVDVPFSVSAGSYLVVEFQFPDSGTDPGVWPANTTTATETTYLKAADCGLTTYSAVGDIGFPDSQIIMCMNAVPGNLDPCDLPLPAVCNADVTGDGFVTVSDLLEVIGTWGQVGDGTFRPTGDCAPMPDGDCMVSVADVLEVISQWGADCAVYGACCLSSGSCEEGMTSDACASLGGTYFGDNSSCADGSCVSGACCISLTKCADYTSSACSGMGGIYHGDGTSCAATDCAAVVDGDEADNAIVIYDGANAFDSTNCTQSPEAHECAADAGAFGWTVPTPDIWLSFTATNSAGYAIDTCDAGSFDQSIIIYEGSSSNQIACNGDGPANGACQLYYSQLDVEMTAGSTYLIRIGGFAAADYGAGTLNINEIPPPLPGACCFDATGKCLDALDSAQCDLFGGVFAGEDTLCDNDGDGKPDICGGLGGADTCAEAGPAHVGANIFDTSLLTDSGFGDPDETQCSGTYLDWGNSPDAWFKFTPISNGLASFSLCDGVSYDTSLVLYEGADCDSLVQVACNGDSTVETGCQAYYSGIYDYQVTAGNPLYIRIGGWQGGSGAGTLTIVAAEDVPSACCVGSDCYMLQIANCANAGGMYYGSGSDCADYTCYQGCPAGTVDEMSACAVDGDSVDLDMNSDPAGAEKMPAGGICGLASVYFDPTYPLPDGGVGATLRDLDFYKSATLDAGGVVTINIGTSGMGVLFGVTDATGAWVGNNAWLMSPGGIEASIATENLPAGDYYILVAPSEWALEWTCDSGLTDYFVTFN